MSKNVSRHIWLNNPATILVCIDGQDTGEVLNTCVMSSRVLNYNASRVTCFD